MLRLPALVFPWPSAKSPHAAQAAASTLALAQSVVLVEGQAALGTFNGFAECVAFGYADAAPERLAVCSDWCAWLWFLDDSVDTLRPETGAVNAFRDQMEAAIEALRHGGTGRRASPFLRYTAALRERLLHLAPGGEAWLQRFCGSVSEYLFRGVLLAVDHWARGNVPALAPYLVQREYDSAMHACLDMIELAAPCSVPDALYAQEHLRRARQLSARVVAFVNDIFSFEREVIVHQNPNNLLRVWMQEHGQDDLAHAVKAAAELIHADIEAFVALESAMLGEPWSQHPAIAPYLRGMKLWMRGNHDWSMTCSRYASATSPFAELRHQAAG